MIEADLQKQANEYLRKRGIQFIHIEKGRGTNRTHRKGIADLVFWTKKGHFAIELKTATGVLSDEQKIWMNEFVESGGKAAVFHSIEEVMDFVEGNCI